MPKLRQPVGFPYLGTLVPVATELLNTLGNEVVPPTRPTRRTINLGVSSSPEFACFPLKILMGTYLELVQRGAATIVATGGVGPCRAGLYAPLHEKMLRSMGYNVDFLVFEPPRYGYTAFYNTVGKLNACNYSILRIWQELKYAWKKLLALDEAEKRLHWLRPRELKRGDADRAYQAAFKRITSSCKSHIDRAILEARAELDSVQIDPARKPLRIGIVGEIYVVLEPASNLGIEKMLGDLGVEVVRSMFITGWTRDNAILDSAGMTGGVDVKKAARRYLDQMIGGHGQESVGHAVLAKKHGLDGIVHLAPFTCIPEIVSRSVMTRLSEDLNIPILTFFIDEQTGEAGVKTRLEAFVDMLSRKKKMGR